MKLTVRVIPNARKNTVAATEAGGLRVHLQAPAVDGKANTALIRILSEHFDVPRSRITIVRGEKSREKIIEIGD